MLAKGHDFPRLTLVGTVGADAALFAADWRAPERLFAQLMQVSGRAGRADLPGEVILQSEYPEHPLYRAIVTHDYPGYAETLLTERRQAGFPPYTYQAILRAEAATMEHALAFLQQAASLPCVQDYPDVALYDPIPMRLFRLMNQERAQLLVESPSRPQLQAFLPVWRETLAALPRKNKLRWHLEVDPLEF
jgi:primosomal protein N' (replication factor Y)